MPMPRAAIRRALRDGGHDDATARCWRCGKTDDAATYCLMQHAEEAQKTSPHRFECEDCLVLAAAEADIAPDAVTAFVDARYLGSMQAAAVLSRFADHHAHQQL
mmetsp:Transcript_20084/g.80128  ORF Transcript_20084/g.80128 Transcript_20084/m.80128 type:complete len:104 (-) Transcript_20084:103-414(-)